MKKKNIENLKKVESLMDSFTEKRDTALVIASCGSISDVSFVGNPQRLTPAFYAILKGGLEKGASEERKAVLISMLDGIRLLLDEDSHESEVLADILVDAINGDDDDDDEEEKSESFDPRSEKCLHCDGFPYCVRNFLMKVCKVRETDKNGK